MENPSAEESPASDPVASLRETQECGSQALDVSIGEEEIWGRLLPLHPNVQVYNFSENSYVFGRGSVDHQLTEDTFDASLLPVISKKHFRISRNQRGSGDPIIYIEDLSSNGTFLNRRPIGKNQKSILKHNDEIGLAHAHRKVFMFYDCTNSDDVQHPAELTSKYTMTRVLGTGNYGEVRLAYKQGTLESCAIKIIKKKLMSANGNTLLMNNISQIQNEVELLQSIDHPCIVHLYDVIEAEERIYIVMELAEGGELFDRITGRGHLTESVAKLYCYQLALAIHHLHLQGITHRDIKPENILLAREDIRSCVKLSDFGLSKLTADASQMSTFCGTQMYIAPELLDFNQRAYTKKVDLWSFGVVVFVCLAGYAPFYDQDQFNQRYLIRSGNFSFRRPVWDSVSQQAKDLICKLLVVNPQERYDSGQTLQHPWFKDDSVMLREAELILTSERNSLNTPEAKEVQSGPATTNGHFSRPANKRPNSSPERRRRMQDAKTPRLMATAAALQ
ncbi:Forkhead-associated (FHA) domain [Trinorchestia longiramus]|nr:Forkhead-associated (FHA) domain [Trinorchestia longiramus]